MNNSQTIVGGASYGRPLSGTEIINRIARIGVRYTDGRDYSKAKRIGIGLFEFSIDIENEYEKYMKTAPNPISYELFANVCGPYWEADLRAEINGEITRFFDNTVKAAELATIVYGGIYQLGGMNISLPRIGGGGMVSAPDIGNIVLAPVIEKGFAVSGAVTAGGVTVNAEAFANLAAACNEQLGNLFYQVYGEGGGGSAGDGYGGGSEGAGRMLPKTTAESINTKLDTYLLEPTHPTGGRKANWFKQALSFDKSNANVLAEQIKFDPKTAVQTATTEFGTKFSQTIPIKGVNGRIIDVEFVWIRNNDGIVRLVTGIPAKR